MLKLYSRYKHVYSLLQETVLISALSFSPILKHHRSIFHCFHDGVIFQPQRFAFGEKHRRPWCLLGVTSPNWRPWTGPVGRVCAVGVSFGALLMESMPVHLIIWLWQHSNFQLQTPPKNTTTKRKTQDSGQNLCTFKKKKVFVAKMWNNCWPIVPTLLPVCSSIDAPWCSFTSKSWFHPNLKPHFH